MFVVNEPKSEFVESEGPQTQDQAQWYHTGFVGGLTVYARERGESCLKSENELLRRLMDEQGFKTLDSFERIAGKQADAEKPLTAAGVADVLLLVFGGGGSIGLPDPNADAMEKIIDKWSEAERQQVVAFADAVYAVANDNEGVEIPEKPACLVAMMAEMNCQFA